MSDRDKGALEEFRQLIATAEPPQLGPQRRAGTRAQTELDDALAGFFRTRKLAPESEPLLRSAALLWHDHLDASHSISQGIETRDGSWLHGIMHRREPDYGNAKYWFRRVGQHDAFPELARRAAELLQKDQRDLKMRLIENGEWMPLAFVDEVEAAMAGDRSDAKAVMRRIQAIEFDVLVEHICASC